MALIESPRVRGSIPPQAHHYFRSKFPSDTPHLLRRRSLVLSRYPIALGIIDPLLQVSRGPG